MNEAQMIQRFNSDSKWFHENISKLRKDSFTEKFVAVKDGKALVADKDIDVVVEFLEKNSINPSFTFIEFVHPKGTVILY